MLSFAKTIGSILLVALVVNTLVHLKFSSSDEDPQDNITELAEAEKAPVKNLKNQRTPASVASSASSTLNVPREVKESEISRSDVDRSNFNTVPDQGNDGRSQAGGAVSMRAPSSSPLIRDDDYSPARGFTDPAPIPLIEAGNNLLPKNEKIDSAKTNSTSSKIIAGGAVAANSDQTSESNSKKSTTIISSNTSNSTSSSASTSSGGVTPTPYSCSASIVGGSFNHPVGVSLSCTNTSTIKYCLGIDIGAGCCNPSATGVNYASQIVVGSTDATYCLSYYGTSATETSVTYEQTYIINSTLPDLQVGNPITYYQTTELSAPGTTYITSNDFGKAGFGIGQINLKTHDPGPAGENLTCEQIVSNYVALPAPTPLTILSLLDVSADNPATQIQIPLRVDQLDYGDNFITSYIEDNNYVTPLYSCSTTKVTLSDFEYFDSEIAFGDAGTNTVREFSGGFSSYGFFEPEATVYRGPAGVSSETQTGEKLKSGLFGIFF